MNDNAEDRIKNFDINDWVVVTPNQGRQMIGVLHDELLDNQETSELLERIEEGLSITLCPVLEFSSEYMAMQDPKTGRQLMHKVPMLSGVDFIMDACVPQYITGVSRVYRLSDAKPEDQKEYEKMIRTALDQITGMKAARLGIVQPGPGGLVLGPNGR